MKIILLTVIQILLGTFLAAVSGFFLSIPIMQYLEEIVRLPIFPFLTHGCFILQENDCTGNACEKIYSLIALTISLSALCMAFAYYKGSLAFLGLKERRISTGTMIILSVGVFTFALSDIGNAIYNYCGGVQVFENPPDQKLCTCVRPDL